MLVFFALLVTGITMAQLNFGVKGGLNIATIKIKHGHTYDRIPDFHAGALAQLKFAEDFAVQAELVYSRQGMKAQTFTGNIPYEDRLSYINVPVLAQYLAESGFHFYTGPQFGFLLKATTTQPAVPADKSYYYKKFDLAWTAGAGHLTRMGLGADVRFNFNLMNMTEMEGANLRQMVWQFAVFYQFK